MSNVLDHQKQQQVLGLGRLGWPVRRIAEATGVDRATARGYLLAAGIRVRGRGRPGERAAKPAISVEVSTDSLLGKPAIDGTVSIDSASPAPTRAPSASACEPYRELIIEALGYGRNAVAIWQDLVDDHGFTARYASVRRFVVKLRGT
ncbi:MAG: IS21-like element ISGau7 family transposase, partial [bacterium]